MPDEWFVVGVTTEPGHRGDVPIPRYIGDIGDIGSWVGRTHGFGDAKWSDLPWHGREMYIVHVTGTQSGLDDLAGRDDAWGKDHEGISDSEAAGYLNDRHGMDRTWDEWQDHYHTG